MDQEPCNVRPRWRSCSAASTTPATAATSPSSSATSRTRRRCSSSAPPPRRSGTARRRCKRWRRSPGRGCASRVVPPGVGGGRRRLGGRPGAALPSRRGRGPVPPHRPSFIERTATGGWSTGTPRSRCRTRKRWGRSCQRRTPGAPVPGLPDEGCPRVARLPSARGMALGCRLRPRREATDRPPPVPPRVNHVVARSGQGIGPHLLSTSWGKRRRPCSVEGSQNRNGR